MPRPTASGKEAGFMNYPENTPGVYVTLCWTTDIIGEPVDGRETRERVVQLPAVPRIGDRVYADRKWDEPMEVVDVHWDAEPARIYVYLE